MVRKKLTELERKARAGDRRQKNLLHKAMLYEQCNDRVLSRSANHKQIYPHTRPAVVEHNNTKLHVCPFRRFGCPALVKSNKKAKLDHISACAHKPPERMPPVAVRLYSRLLDHTSCYHPELNLGKSLCYWRDMKVPELLADGTRVPDVPVFVNMAEWFPAGAPAKDDIIAEIMEQLTKASFPAAPVAALMSQMSPDSTHSASAVNTITGFKPSADIMATLGLVVPPEYAAPLGVDSSSPFHIDITPVGAITNVQMDAGSNALLLPLLGWTLVLLFRPTPIHNVATAQAEAAANHLYEVDPAEWFASRASELRDPWIAAVSAQDGRALWIPAGWKHVAFTLFSTGSYQGGFTCAPKAHIGEGSTHISESEGGSDELIDALLRHLDRKETIGLPPGAAEGGAVSTVGAAVGG
ncbi:hypothetical protein FN846DRAFT_971087 [Sphaerosporella brunnea]|uniref:Uncharacterized protein n=1 Tax=Sphaerosporella brunnea TaxID=1250544 RepID=A0A5J5EJJ3_9PEZI|nr:hypothetical protein FN846DRAFT_971087 [Sphaerosporella brunnea]